MGSPPRQAITDLRAVPGELSFEARIGGERKRIFFRTETPVTPPADAALAACLMPAMRAGGTLTMSDPVSPRVLRGQREFAAIQRAWSLAREFGERPLRELELLAPARELAPRQPTGRVAAFFSGGVDSWATLLDHPEVTDLIFVRGIDLLPGTAHQAELADRVEAQLGEVAAEVGLPLHRVETNVRELSDPLIRWESYYVCPLHATALIFEPIFDRVMFAGGTDYGTQDRRAGARFASRLWSSEWLEIAEDGGRFSRIDRVRAIADQPLAQRSLRVCWENRDGAYNCGKCPKCLQVMASLEVLGKRGEFTTFPPELDRAALTAEPDPNKATLLFREDLLDTAVESGSDLVPELRAVVERGRRDLGLPAGGRQRQGPRPGLDRGRGPAQEIADLRAVPGELSFEARIGGERKRIFFRTETPVTPPADAALAACLMPAMRAGGTLTMSDPVSPRVLRGQREFAAAQAAWSQSWSLHGGPLRGVEVRAPERELAPRQPTGRVAVFFSGGVDSFAAILDNPEVTDLIFVRGVDLLPDQPDHMAVAEDVELRVREAAAKLGLELHVVETNVRELSDGVVPWEAYFSSPLVAVAHFFESRFDRVLIASDTDYELQGLLGYGSIWTVEQLWSSEWVEIVSWGGRMTREQRVRLVATSPTARRMVRVCWRNPGGAYNCGACSKCLITMIALEAQGELGRFESFPPLDLSGLERMAMTQRIQLVFWEDLLTTVRVAGRRDLVPAVAAYVERGRRDLGEPPSFRGRASAGEGGGETWPRPGAETALFAEPETAAALAAAPAAALLVGSYDGSGNFGDIAQLEGALTALAPLERLLVLPVIELGAANRHRDPAIAPRGVDRVVYFDPSGGGAPGLVPLPPPARLAFGLCFLYGGGYLNADWGERKLAMLGAAEALLGGARGGVCRVASGLQVEPGWLDELAPELRAALRSFELLGGRDPASTEALGTIGGDAVLVEGGDDALGAWPRLRPGPASPAADPPSLNLHFSDHAWVTDDPARMRDFCAELVGALAAGRGLRVRPLLSYVDRLTDEREGLDRLAAGLADRGVELLEPQLLRSAELERLAPELGAATLTLSCSYHAALASLLLGVPAVLLEDLPYYEQKAAGLRAGFGLPPELRANSREDAAAVAGRLVAVALEPGPGAALRASLALAAERARTRRTGAEAALLGALAGAGIDRLGASDAELGVLVGSRSWRLTEPLRRGTGRLRQRLRG